VSPAWSPCPRTVFIRRLRRLGFEGPLAGGNHQFMVFRCLHGRRYRVALPSNRDYAVDQVRRLLRQVERALGRPVDLNEWLALEK